MAENPAEKIIVEIAKEVVVNFIVEPIKRQSSYIFFFTRNIQKLKDELQDLRNARDGLQSRVDTAKNNDEVILPVVTTWLDRTDEKLSSKIEMENNTNIGCLSFKSRYSLSKRAVKTTEATKKLLEECPKFDEPISHPPPPASMVPDILQRLTREFDSRKEVEDDIMALLMDEKVKIIGICGMGGVGKTTLAVKIKNRVLTEETQFGESVMVVVSRDPNKMEIQGDIAEKLGLKLDGMSFSSRAQRLCSRLMDRKRILIVFDDVWEYLNLEELGIPCNKTSGCTVLLTSRDRGVLSRMNAETIREIHVLTGDEALSFFKEKLGIHADGDEKNWVSIKAQEIAKECRGLPLALESVARALKDEKSKSVWEDALLQLRSSSPEDMPEVLKGVYAPLKLSYDFLSSQNVKFIFLLCCLFPEDFHISLEDLTAYSMGLHMFEGIKDLEQVRNKTYSLIERLKSRSLILEGSDGQHVRMHDVVRDIAIFIASKEERLIKCHDDSTWISPFHGEGNVDLSSSSTYPNLRLLMTEGSYDGGDSFEGMKQLNVLSIRNNGSLWSLPHSMQFLKNLHTMILESCESLTTIGAIGELVNLEILICRECRAIEELPPETKVLNKLRLLEISSCWALQKIERGVLSSLNKLEELKIVISFNKWGENENVGLNELESLLNLTHLEIEVKDYNLAAQNISLPSKMQKYFIYIGEKCNYYELKFDKIMFVNLGSEVILGKWVEECVKNVEYLYLTGDGSNCLDLSVAQNIKSLDFRSCSTVSSVVGRCDATAVFPVVEKMKLYDLSNLEEIVRDMDGSDQLPCLKELSLMFLPALKRLWSPNVVSHYSHLSSVSVFDCGLGSLLPLSTARDCFPQLEKLSVECSEMMEHIFSWNEEEEENVIEQECDHQGMKSIHQFPFLTKIKIWGCPQLKGVISSFQDDHHSSHFFCKQHRVSFASNLREVNVQGNANMKSLFCPQIPLDHDFYTKLEVLRIESFDDIKILFSVLVAQNLVNLQSLTIKNCNEMVLVIGDDEEKNATGQTTNGIKFPKLKKLELINLPRLTSVCKGIESIEFPKLQLVTFEECPLLEGVVSQPSHDYADHHSLHLFCHHQVSLSELKELYLVGNASCEIAFCPKIPISFFTRLEWLEIKWHSTITHLFSSSVAANLINLKNLRIESCGTLAKVIEEEEYSHEAASSTLHFLPHLEYLYLNDLPQLKFFCGWKCALELPSLNYMGVDDCPKMERFSSGSLATPKLKRVWIRPQEVDITGDNLNDVMKKCFLGEKFENPASCGGEDEYYSTSSDEY